MKKREQATNNSAIAIVFFIFLAVIIGISLIIRLVFLFESGRYTDSRSFALNITNNRNTEALLLSPSQKKIAVFKFKNKVSSLDAEKILKIPIDGYIFSNSIDLNQKTDSLVLNAIANYGNLKTNITIVDLLRIELFVKSVSEASIDTEFLNNVDDLNSDNTMSRLMSDSAIEKDNQTIQIINATNISGLGARLAKLITNIGGNVIMVTTDNNQKKDSIISFIDKRTYTVDRLQKILGYPVVREIRNSISDITIVIGESKIDLAPF